MRSRNMAEDMKKGGVSRHSPDHIAVRLFEAIQNIFETSMSYMWKFY